MAQEKKAVINDENLVDVRHKHQIVTLIDITYDTANQKKNTKGFYQNQNYNTFVQASSFRSQVFEPTVSEQILSVDSLFGKHYIGERSVWTLNFYTEVPVPELKDDINGMPIHDDELEVIDTSDIINCNTIVKNFNE